MGICCSKDINSGTYSSLCQKIEMLDGYDGENMDLMNQVMKDVYDYIMEICDEITAHLKGKQFREIMDRDFVENLSRKPVIESVSSIRVSSNWVSDFVIIKACILLPGFTHPPFTDELLRDCVHCIQRILCKMKNIDGPLSNQLQLLHEKLEYLVNKIRIVYRKHYSEQEELSELRVHFQTMMRNRESIIYSINKDIHSTSDRVELSYLSSGIIYALLSLERSSLPLSKNLLMGYLQYFLILQHIISYGIPTVFSNLTPVFWTIRNLNRKIATDIDLFLYNLIKKVHEGSYNANEGSSPPPLTNEVLKQLLDQVACDWLKDHLSNNDDWSYRHAIGCMRFPKDLLLQLDSSPPLTLNNEILREILVDVGKILVWLLNDEDLGLLVSLTQNLSNIAVQFQGISIINLSIYNKMKKRLITAMERNQLSDSLSRILKDVKLQLDYTPPLIDGFHVLSLDCIQNILNKLLKDVDTNLTGPSKDQFIIGHEELGLLVRLFNDLWSYMKQEIQFDDTNQAQPTGRNLGSEIYSSFNSETKKHLAIELSGVLHTLHGNIKDVNEAMMRIVYPVILKKLRDTSPSTDLHGFLEFLLGNLELIDNKSDFIINLEHLQTIKDGLVMFRSFFESIKDSRRIDDESQALSKRIKNAAYEAEYFINSFIVGVSHVRCESTVFSNLGEEINLIKKDVMEFMAKKDSIIKDPCGMLSPAVVPTINVRRNSIQTRAVFVGFKDEVNKITELVIDRGQKELNVISITGMPGIGKTTLAKKVYDTVVHQFDIHAWCCVSQEYNKKQLLLDILGCMLTLKDIDYKKSDTDLSEMLHKVLFERRCLIVMDDVWEIKAFNDLKRFFQDNRKCSRIILTSRRNKLVESGAKYHINPFELRLFKDNESWDLLEHELYHEEKCPSELCEVGMEIAQKCGGLPLAVVMVAGLLSKSDPTLDSWKQFATTLSSHIAHNSQTQWMAVLDLSYKFLPDHLKPLFLYLGAFPEDKEIPVKILKWLWIAEGFVRKTDHNKSLDDEAEKNLEDLIDRNLLMVVRKSYNDGVKTCRIHDLIREMSLEKAEQENFLRQIHVCNEDDQSLPDPMLYHYRVCISGKEMNEYKAFAGSLVTYERLQLLSMTPPLCSLLHFKRDLSSWKETSKSIFFKFKLLRVLHFACPIEDYYLPSEIMLKHLRYISISIIGMPIQFPPSICTLVNIETLIVKGEPSGVVIVVPEEIWKMVKLRHLHIDYHAHFSAALDNSSKLENLQTLSTPEVDYDQVENLITRVPNIRKLKCKVTFIKNSRSEQHQYELPQLESLVQLESLTLKSTLRISFTLPPTLKKLSLIDCNLQWNDISLFQKLPKLQVLKLRQAVKGELWEMGDDDKFPMLIVLKLYAPDLIQWIISEDHFPSLKKVVLKDCKKLKKVPSRLGNIDSLEMMEARNCSKSATDSTIKILEKKNDLGHRFDLHIFPPKDSDEAKKDLDDQ